ncbi:MAG: winged helix-turn-helix domain-containing protein, partial [Candidatus Hodarchaeota archaeon]
MIIKENNSTDSLNMAETENPVYLDLQGKTLRIYSYLLTHSEAGIRELQRNLGLSSSNVVTHHIKKLKEQGLVTQNSENNKY